MTDHVHLAPLLGGIDVNNQLAFKHSLLDSTETALGTVQLAQPQESIVRELEIITTSSGGETIAITGSIDGTNFEAAFAPIDKSTGLITTSTDLASGTYTIPGNLPYQQLKFTKSAGVNQGLVSLIEVHFPKS